MQMKTAHLVSVLIVVAILLAALPSPSAIRQDRDPPTTRTTKILTTTTSFVPTTVTTTKIVTTTRHTFLVPTTIQSFVYAQTIDSSLNTAPVGGQIAPYDLMHHTWLLSLAACLLALLLAFGLAYLFRNRRSKP
jgi:hypothetical protein